MYFIFFMTSNLGSKTDTGAHYMYLYTRYIVIKQTIPKDNSFWHAFNKISLD